MFLKKNKKARERERKRGTERETETQRPTSGENEQRDAVNSEEVVLSFFDISFEN